MALNTNDGPVVSINITPFVDVVLVLLIIFMAAASYIVSPAIEVDLPEAASAEPSKDEQLALVLDAEGQVYLNGAPVSREGLAAACRDASAREPNILASISADGKARYERVVELLDLVKLNGIANFALNVELPVGP